MRYCAAIYASLLAVGCGGQPVGGKVPRAKPAHVGGAAAAAAALITLADPDAARQRQEERGGARDKDKTKRVNETVPEGVLFAPSDPEGEGSKSEDEELPPCKAPASESKEPGKKSGAPIELFPPVSEGTIATPERCRDTSKEEQPQTGEDEASKSPQDQPGAGDVP